MTWTTAISWGCYVVAVVLLIAIGIIATGVCWNKGKKLSAVLVGAYFLLVLLLIPAPVHALVPTPGNNTEVSPPIFILCVLLWAAIAIGGMELLEKFKARSGYRIVFAAAVGVGVWFIPTPSHAMEIVTCQRAAGLMADLASARDRGMEEPEGRKLLYTWIRYYHVSDIQGARLRYDMHGLFTDYVLRHASPDEIREGTLRNCPHEYAR